MKRSILACLALAAAATTARAEPAATGLTLGLDAGGAAAISTATTQALGRDVLAHLGYQLGGGLAPELAVGYTSWGTPSVLAFEAGATWRRGGEPLSPWIDAHLGVAALTTHGSDFIKVEGALAIEAGAGLAYALTSALAIDAHVRLNACPDGDGALASKVAWLEVGVGLAVRLGGR